MCRRIIHRRILQFSIIILLLLGGFLWTTSRAFVTKFSVSNSNSLGTDVDDYFYDYTDLKTLKVVQVIFRHGARTPLNPFPTDVNADYKYNVKGTGQLLQKGRRQAYHLGKYLRARYDGYLSKLYDLDQVYTQSSDIDRTIMTAEMCLAGLFSGSKNDEIVSGLNWEPIPIRSLPKRIDNKIAFDASCPKHRKLTEEFMNSARIVKFEKENKEIYKLATAHSGLTITNYEQLRKLTDTLMVEEENDLQLSPWTHKIFPIKTLAGFRLGFITETATEAMQPLIISPLVTEMVRNINLVKGNTPLIESVGGYLADYHNRTAKIYLYSGHDSTISAFLNSFDLYDGDQPTYVSALVVEVHYVASKPNNETDENYIVKLFYKKERNEPIQELYFPLCSTPCTVSSFRKSYAKFLMDYLQWTTACKI